MAVRQLPVGLCVGLTVFASSIAAPAEAAVNQAAAGSVGWDLSTPQCAAGSATPPAGATFTIVGVTGGTAYSANSCLAQEYTAQSSAGVATGLYVNTGNPGHTSANWQDAAAKGPLTCSDLVDDDDYACAYDYGYNAGLDALAGAVSVNPSVKDGIWWMDVETSNSWLPADASVTTASAADKFANAADLQGEMDALYAGGVAEVGIYSTALQWNQITGNYNLDSAKFFQTNWNLGPTVTYSHPLAKAPLWIPTGSFDEYQAYEVCTQSYTGAPVLLGQFLGHPTPTTTLDADLVCGGPAPESIAGAPRSPTAKAGAKKGTVALSWQAPASNGGEPITGYLIYRGTSGGHLSAYRTMNCTAAACAWTDSAAEHDRKYYYKVAAVNEVGDGHRSTYVTAKGK